VQHTRGNAQARRRAVGLRASDFLRMQQRQIEIVRRARPALKPNGLLVYSTCSLEPEKTRSRFVEFSQSSPDLRLAEEKRGKVSLPFRDGFDGAYAGNSFAKCACYVSSAKAPEFNLQPGQRPGK